MLRHHERDKATAQEDTLGEGNNTEKNGAEVGRMINTSRRSSKIAETPVSVTTATAHAPGEAQRRRWA